MRYHLPGMALASAVISSTIAPALAESVIPDGTINTQVIRSGNTFQIQGGTTAGNNLFHSFQEFSIPTGGSASFEPSSNITTIFSRVTGNQASQIEGTLKVLGNADLFLMNPNGIVFGKGARLDVKGSLITTTASAIVFGNQGQFSATGSTSADLLSIQPSALWFNHNPQPITVLGNSPWFRQDRNSPNRLQAAPGKTLALVGGDINLVGANINFDRAQLSITGIASSGTVPLSKSGAFWSIQPELGHPLANININQGTLINSGKGQSSKITIKGDLLNILDNSRIETLSLDSNNGGDIELQANQLLIEGKSSIASDSRSTGSPGRQQITATESIKLKTAFITSATFGSAKVGGEINLSTGILSVRGGSTISTSAFNSGNAGMIRINASQTIEVGEIDTDPSRLVASSIESSAMKFRIPAIRLSLGLPEVPSGNAGNIHITTDRLRIFDRGQISVRNDGTGDAGNIDITANSVKLERFGRLSADTKSGEGGNLDIQSQLLLLRDRSQIETSALGKGNGGNIKIQSPLMIGINNSDIVANAEKGRGGNIQITTQGILGLKFRTSLTNGNDITASSQFGVNGTVEIRNFGLDPSSGLAEFSETFTGTHHMSATGCSSAQENSFTVTGRGGIPNPTDNNQNRRPWSDMRALSPIATSPITDRPLQPNSKPLLEATTWQQNLQTGAIELIAPTASQMLSSATCAIGANTNQ